MNIVYKILNKFIVYAAGGDAFSTSGFDQLIGWMVGISTGLAVVASSVCLIRIMVTDDPRTLADAKEDMKQVIIAWLALNSLGAITYTIFSLVDTGNF